MYNGQLKKRDTVMTIAEFSEIVEEGFFSDFDGFAYPVKDGKFDAAITIYPSEVKNIPKEATHTVWFNK